MELIICETIDVAVIYKGNDEWVTPDGKYTIWDGWVGCGNASTQIEKIEEVF